MYATFLKCWKYRLCIFFLLSTGVTGCAGLNELPVMGTVSEGVYTQAKGNFSCPLRAKSIGLQGIPHIIDATRVIKTEHIPLSQRAPSDARHTRIVSNETFPSRLVKFEDKSGTIIEFNSGIRMHETNMVLNSGMSGGVSWRFDRREIARSSGRMVMGLLLVPWHDENDNYMGINAARAYRQGQGPDARLWIVSNIVIDQAIHTIEIKLPLAPLLTPGTNLRDLSAVRDDIGSRPELQETLFTQASNWLAQCHFAKEPK